MTERRPLPNILQRNAFRTSEAAEWGITRGRLRANDLGRPFHGVRTAGLDPEGLVDRCRAAETILGPAQAFSHATALALWGAPVGWEQIRAPLHVATLGRGRMRRPGVVGHQIAETTTVRATPDGLRAVAPEDAWCQFAGQRGTTELALIAAGDFLITGRRERGGFRHPAPCTIAQMTDAVARASGRRGARLLAAALPSIRSGPASPKETELRLLLIAAGLGEPVVGHRIRTRLGPLEPDLAYPAWRVLLEYEGDAHRSDRRRWRGDFERVRAFQEAGWVVIRVNADDLSDPARRTALLAHLRTLLRP